MTISSETHDGELIIKVSGWLDIASCADFSAFVSSIPVQEKLVLDLDGLEYISSSGIREIVKIILRQPKDSFSIINVNPMVMSVFDIVGLGKKVPVCAKQ